MKRFLLAACTLVLAVLVASCGSGAKMNTTVIASIVPENLSDDDRKVFMDAIPSYMGYEQSDGSDEAIKSLEDGRMAYVNSHSLYLVDTETGTTETFNFEGFNLWDAVDITSDGRYALCATRSYSDGININIYELESTKLGGNGNLNLIGNWNNSWSSSRKDISLIDAKITDDGSKACFVTRHDTPYIEQDSIYLITDRDWSDQDKIYYTNSKDEKIRSIAAFGESKVIANTDIDRNRYRIMEIAEGMNSRWQSSRILESGYPLTSFEHEEKLWVSEIKDNRIRISSYDNQTWTGRRIDDFTLTIEDAVRIDGFILSPSGERIAVYYRPGLDDTELHLTKMNVYDIKDRKANLLSSFAFPTNETYKPVFIDENTLKSDRFDNYIVKLDSKLYSFDLIKLPKGSLPTVAISEDGKFAFAQSETQAIILKRDSNRSGFHVMKEVELRDAYCNVAFAPDSSFIALNSFKELLIIDLESGKETSIMIEDSPYSIAINSANEIIMGFDGKFVVYEYTGNDIYEKTTVENKNEDFGFRVACGGNNIFVSSNESIHIYDSSLKEIAQLKIKGSEKTSRIHDIEASSDGSRIVLAEGSVSSRTIRVIDKTDEGYSETNIQSADASRTNNSRNYEISATNDGHTLFQTFRDDIYVLSDRSGSWKIISEIQSPIYISEFDFAICHDVSADGKTIIIGCDAPFAMIMYPVLPQT